MIGNWKPIDAVVRFDSFVDELRKHAPGALRERFEWDIYLTNAKELKTEILKADSMSSLGFIN